MNHSKGNLKHTRCDCKYHVVFIAKYRRKNIDGWIRTELGPIIRELAQQKEAVVEEGHLMGGSRAHVVVDTPEVFSVWGGGVYQGQKCDSHSAEVYGSGEEFCWAKLLGEGVLRIDGGAGRGRDTALHQRARERG